MFDNFFQRFLNAFVINEGYNLMLKGIINTLIIAAVALVLGVILGTIFAVVKVLPQNGFNKVLSAIADVYITVIRGIPIVVLLLLFYFGVMSPLGVHELVVACIVFGINSSAYVAEIIRSGILAVERGQLEAGRSLGLSYGTTMFKIVLPQAIKNIMPALGNELIVLIKETSVASFITVFDLTRAARAIVSQTYDTFVPYIVLAACYLFIVLIVTFVLKSVERWVRRSDIR